METGKSTMENISYVKNAQFEMMNTLFPSLSQGSKTAYISLFKNFFTIDKFTILTPEIIREHILKVEENVNRISEKNELGQKSILNAIIVFATALEIEPSIIETYRVPRGTAAAVVKNILKKNLPSQSQRDNWIDWADVLNVLKQTETSLKVIDRFMKEKKQIHLFLSMVTMLPPRRNDDYIHLHTTDITKNHLVLSSKHSKTPSHIHYQIYKTAEIYGKQSFVIPFKLKQLFCDYIDTYGCSNGYIFTKINGSPFTTDEFTKYIQSIFINYYDRQISINMLRHSYITYFNSTNPSVEDRERTASMMGHNTQQQLLYVLKI
jgi:hypothetical protein